MRAIVCGGRDYQNSARLNKVLNAAIVRLGLSVVIHGGAMGADLMAEAWAKRNGIDHVKVKAQWGKLGNAAGPIRNQRMIDEFAPDLVIAFPPSDETNGTRDMVRRAEKAGLPVHRIDWPAEVGTAEDKFGQTEFKL